MNEASFLSKLILVISILVLIFVFLVFPSILNNPKSELNLFTLNDVWESGEIELPIITKLSVSFAENSILRYILFAALILTGILTEFFVESKKTSGLVHAFNLIIGILMGTIYLFSLVIPFMPL